MTLHNPGISINVLDVIAKQRPLDLTQNTLALAHLFENALH